MKKHGFFGAVVICLSVMFLLCGCTETDSGIPAESTQPTNPATVQSEVPISPQTDPATAPEEIPPIPAQDQLISADPKTLDEWVFTNYEQTVSWRDQADNYRSMTLSLPALTPVCDFALQFNQTIFELGSLLLDEALDCQARGSVNSTVSLTYEAFLQEDLLFIVLTRRVIDGYSLTNSYAFDLEDREALRVGDVCEELLDMDYPAFLLAANALVEYEFMQRYAITIAELEENSYNGTDSYFATEPIEEVEAYYQALERIPLDALHIAQRGLYVDEAGQILLICRIPTLNAGEYVPAIIPFNLSQIQWDGMPTEQQAYGQLFDMQFYVDGIHADAYSTILAEAFFADPEDFVEHAAGESSDSLAFIASLLDYALMPEEVPAYERECRELLKESNLSEKQIAVINTLLDALS